MIRLSANLGFLWNDRPLPDAIRAAATAGFEAVEFHWPYEVPTRHVLEALTDTGLPLLGLNTKRGDLTEGENGVSALPGRGAEARAYIDEALAYAVETHARNIHVMAGYAEQNAASRTAFLENLDHACGAAAKVNKTILIEPLNRYDAPNYFLQTSDQAIGLIEELGATNLKLMYDCYHLQIMQGDVVRRLTAAIDHVGHIQIAAVPDRGEPDQGELDYGYVLSSIAEMGWSGFVGAEYKPRGGKTETGLDWIKAYAVSAR